MSNPRVIEVIESEDVRGEGVAGDPCRVVMQYHTLDGTLLAENDAWAMEQCRLRTMESDVASSFGNGK